MFCATLLQNIRFFPSTHSTPFSANIQFVYNLIYSAMLRIKIKAKLLHLNVTLLKAMIDL